MKRSSDCGTNKDCEEKQINNEIRIIDGHDSSSYFWIMPIKVLNYSDTNDWENTASMISLEISIEEDDVDQYLAPFLYRYFDDELEANKKRVDVYWIDDEGNERIQYHSGFQWNLTENFYTFLSVRNIINDILNTIDALLTGRETEYAKKIREKRGFATWKLVYARNMTEEQIKRYNEARPKENTTEVGMIVDFYRRFISRLENMIKTGEENGYDLITFMGP